MFKDKKKRYALHVLDAENTRVSKGHKDELKITGMEVKRSDTPKIIQDFLQECLRKVLVDGYEQEDLRSFIEEFRLKFRNLPPWKQGSPVRVHNLQTSDAAIDEYIRRLGDPSVESKKPQIYYAVMAAINTNFLMEKFKEQRWDSIKDGDKVDVLYLKPGNEYNLDSVAIRVGEDYIPDWFSELPFDIDAHERKLIDQKLENTFGGLGWQFAPRDHEGWDIFS
jgi:hypothetical protein